VLNQAQLKEHTLNRLGYGLGAWHSNRYDQLGFEGYVAEQLQQALPAITINDVFIAPKIARNVVEQRGLEAVLLDFWFNHFNVNATNNNPEGRTNDPVGITLPYYQNEIIGSNVLGNFGDMLLATAHRRSIPVRSLVTTKTTPVSSWSCTRWASTVVTTKPTCSRSPKS